VVAVRAGTEMRSLAAQAVVVRVTKILEAKQAQPEHLVKAMQAEMGCGRLLQIPQAEGVAVHPRSAVIKQEEEMQAMVVQAPLLMAQLMLVAAAAVQQPQGLVARAALEAAGMVAAVQAPMACSER